MEEGIAHLYFISNNQTILYSKLLRVYLKKELEVVNMIKVKLIFFRKF